MNLENLYKKVFPGRSFAGNEPMPGIDSPTPDDYYFLLNDGNHTYDLVEMSAGEQSVFPILYQFVRLQIAHSIVLIDEIDLNLHPPAAQTLVSQLPKIGPTCQFIITTHSEAVNGMIGDDETFRLPGVSYACKFAFCEGNDKSPDQRMLAILLSGICQVRGVGGKYEFSQRIRFARENKLEVFGIRDRDFNFEDTTYITSSPRKWQGKDNDKTILLGWYWERTEIENYLIDPHVVEKALSSKVTLSIQDYQSALAASAESLTYYTAARLALSRSRRVHPL